MILAIWGTSACGKSMLADVLGKQYSEHDLTAVIDTNPCMPTLPLRIGGLRTSAEHSLGRYLTGTGSVEVKDYYMQHPEHRGLFYTGLTANDTYLSYEVDLQSSKKAVEFLDRSARFFNSIILDCSVQRSAPFLGAMLERADVILLPMIPNPAAVHWYNAIRDMLTNARVLGKCIFLANMVSASNLTNDVEGQTGIEFAARLPYLRDASYLQDSGKFLTDSSSHFLARWNKEFRLLQTAIDEYQAGDGTE